MVQQNKVNPAAGWKKTHDPEARPLGCNGKYGMSGIAAHRRKGRKPCMPCRYSGAHYRRELRRGGIKTNKPKPIPECGTHAAVSRHNRRKEKLDLMCRLFEAERSREYQRARRAAERAA